MGSTDVSVINGSASHAAKGARKRKATGAADGDSFQFKKVHQTRAQAKAEMSMQQIDSNTAIGLNIVIDGGSPPDDFTQNTGASESDSTGLNGDPGTPPGDPVIEPLSPPSGQPPVSANIRAALCDSIDYWRAHQGGIQSSNMTATGMLLNGKTTPRDVLQAQVIVTTVGGGMKTGPDGGRIRVQDQSDNDKNYVTMKNAMEGGEPIGVVVGKQAQGKGSYLNNLLAVNVENHFNVLGWFFITDIWSEYQPTQRDGTRYKHYVIRLQKIDLESTSWWIPQSPERVNMHTVGEFHCRALACEKCGTQSKEIFTEGWCCLEQTCEQFFRFADPTVNLDNLHYAQNFLNERTEWNSDKSLSPLVPELMQRKPHEFGSEERFKRGIICPNCLFASRRVSWNGWVCEKGCGFEAPMAPLDVPMAIVRQENEQHLAKKAKYFEIDTRIKVTKHDISGYEVSTFYLPNTPQNLGEAEFIGSVTVFHPTQCALEREGGLDELFQDIQEATRVGDIELRRRPAFCRGSHMEELTSHFSCNMGADYKFGVVVETSRGFDSAPAPVMKALSRLTWGGATAVTLTSKDASETGISVDSQSMPDQFIDFNEQLMLGYFEKSQISYHDDGEKELGPTVATLSLGSPSTMRFRSKRKSGIEGAHGGNNVMLSMVLEHGDMVIMHGTKIHQYYEHAVTAGGIRRYALTARYIRPEMMESEERREKALVNGRVPVYWQKQAYKGEAPDQAVEPPNTAEGDVIPHGATMASGIEANFDSDKVPEDN